MDDRSKNKNSNTTAQAMTCKNSETPIQENAMKAENIQISKTRDQVSMVNLNTINEQTRELNISEIQNFTEIPDYALPAHSDHPIVCETPSGLYCIDGWALIAEAQKSGAEKITAKIYIMQEHSDDELRFRKIEARQRTEGGRALYIETLRNIKIVADTLSDTDPNLIRFCHGGRRRGLVFNEKSEALSIVDVLMSRMGAKRNTVQKYYGYTAYLTLDTLNLLVQEAVVAEAKADARTPGSRFFNLIAKQRTPQVKALKEAANTEDEITKRISAQILAWWREYKDTGIVEAIKVSRSRDVEDESDDELQTDLSFKEEPAVKPRTEKPLTFDEIRAAYRKSLKVISEYIEADHPDDTVAIKFENAMEEIIEAYAIWKADRAQKVAEAA
jgi:hypothetical protein